MSEHLPARVSWNVKFAKELAERSTFRARELIAGKDAMTLAMDILAPDEDAFSAAFRKSPMKRKMEALQRNAAVVLRNAETSLTILVAGLTCCAGRHVHRALC